MKYEKYKEDLEKALPKTLSNALLENISIWTNEACYGYVAMTLEASGFSAEKIEEILQKMYYIFDLKSPEEAEAFFRKWRAT